MDDKILDPEGARERLAAWKGRIDKLAADTQAMGERPQAVRVTASDPTGLVEVTVDSTGALVDLKLTERMQRTEPAVGRPQGQQDHQSRPGRPGQRHHD
jgi:hypothetical protein